MKSGLAFLCVVAVAIAALPDKVAKNVAIPSLFQPSESFKNAVGCIVDEKIQNMVKDWKQEQENMEKTLEKSLENKMTIMENKFLEKLVSAKIEELLRQQASIKEDVAGIASQQASCDKRLVPAISTSETSEGHQSHAHEGGNSSFPSNCLEVLNAGNSKSGIYTIQVLSHQFQWGIPMEKEIFPTNSERGWVFCNMDTDGGGWTVFQRRSADKPRINFFQSWKDYQDGFGDLDGEFWLGLEHIHLLTYSKPMSLRVDVEDFSGQKRFAVYKYFDVGNEQEKYRLRVTGYSGDSGDSLSYHNYMAFSTRDADNDKYETGNCAVDYYGGWWYKVCHESNLNGRPSLLEASPETVCWKGFKDNYESMNQTEMKMRPAF